MDLLRVGLEAEGKVSGETIGKVLRLEFNEGMTIGSGSAELGVALAATLDVAADKVLDAAGAALDDAIGRVLGSTSDVEGMSIDVEVESIEIEEGRLIVLTD